ncbi:hypothetical protein CPB86DRAFT_118731 [Serendipita vermifera]|nr:hypothetical protein CPB86DRAFT_118731 [Serendipita vermifera]
MHIRTCAKCSSFSASSASLPRLYLHASTGKIAIYTSRHPFHFSIYGYRAAANARGEKSMWTSPMGQERQKGKKKNLIEDWLSNFTYSSPVNTPTRSKSHRSGPRIRHVPTSPSPSQFRKVKSRLVTRLHEMDEWAIFFLFSPFTKHRSKGEGQERRHLIEISLISRAAWLLF